MTAVCKSFAQMAIDLGQATMLQSLKPLRSALEKLQDTPVTWTKLESHGQPHKKHLAAQETLTPVHMEFLRVCLKVKVYHIAAQLLDHSAIYDIAVSTGGGNSSTAVDGLVKKPPESGESSGSSGQNCLRSWMNSTFA